MNFFQRMKSYASAAKKISRGMNLSPIKRFGVFCDVLYCKLVMHCSFEEYCFYNFHRLKNSHRKNFILKYHQQSVYSKINPPLFTMHKKVLYKQIQRGIRREVLYLPEAGEDNFLDFVRKHKKVITKPDAGSRGRDVQLFEYQNDAQALEFFHSLKEETVCEEYIIQHEAMSSLNPNSVNSLRIVALCDDGKVTIIAASLKTGGTPDSIADNMHNNGIGANVDIQSGVVTGYGYNYRNQKFIYHPVSLTQIIGFAVPFWPETLKLVKKTHLDVPQCPLIGWDVAITPTGPEIIEANGRPGPKLMQLMDKKPKGKYLKDYIKKHKLKKPKQD